MMVEIKMIASVGDLVKGRHYRVAADHWLIGSGYAQVVGVVEELVEQPKKTRVRKPKEVSDVADRAESDGGPDLGADSGS